MKIDTELLMALEKWQRSAPRENGWNLNDTHVSFGSILQRVIINAQQREIPLRVVFNENQISSDAVGNNFRSLITYPEMVFPDLQNKLTIRVEPARSYLVVDQLGSDIALFKPSEINEIRPEKLEVRQS